MADLLSLIAYADKTGAEFRCVRHSENYMQKTPWNITFRFERDGVKVEINELGKDLESVVDAVWSKLHRAERGLTPGLMLEAPTADILF